MNEIVGGILQIISIPFGIWAGYKLYLLYENTKERRRNPIRNFFKAAHRHGIEFEMPKPLTEDESYDLFFHCCVMPRLQEYGEMVVKKKDKEQILARMHTTLFIGADWSVTFLTNGDCLLKAWELPRQTRYNTFIARRKEVAHFHGMACQIVGESPERDMNGRPITLTIHFKDGEEIIGFCDEIAYWWSELNILNEERGEDHEA